MIRRETGAGWRFQEKTPERWTTSHCGLASCPEGIHRDGMDLQNKHKPSVNTYSPELKVKTLRNLICDFTYQAWGCIGHCSVTWILLFLTGTPPDLGHLEHTIFDESKTNERPYYIYIFYILDNVLS